jgi:hypothetical protein
VQAYNKQAAGCPVEKLLMNSEFPVDGPTREFIFGARANESPAAPRVHALSSLPSLDRDVTLP